MALIIAFVWLIGWRYTIIIGYPPFSTRLFALQPTEKSPIATDKYRAGYTDCAREVARYLSTPEPPPLPSVPNIADAGCRTRLLRHLDLCIAEIETEICPRISTPSNSTTKTTQNNRNGSGSSSSSNTNNSIQTPIKLNDLKVPIDNVR